MIGDSFLAFPFPFPLPLPFFPLPLGLKNKYMNIYLVKNVMLCVPALFNPIAKVTLIT